MIQHAESAEHIFQKMARRSVKKNLRIAVCIACDNYYILLSAVRERRTLFLVCILPSVVVVKFIISA